MRTSKNGKDLIKSFEGFSQTGYLLGDGVVTAGWGSTSLHHNIQPGASYSMATLEQWFTEDLRQFEQAVDRINQDGVFNQNQYDAVVSFVYNLGSGVLMNDPVLVTELRNHDPHSMILYRNAGTQFEAGLKRRRQAEINLFNTPVGARPKYIQKFVNVNNEFTMYKPFKIDEVKHINGMWQVVNYGLAGSKKPNWTYNGIPAGMITLVDKNGKKLKDQNTINPGMYAKIDLGYNHGTIDQYDDKSNGVGIEMGKFGMIWFDAEYMYNKI